MANTLLTPDLIADQALATLYETTVMANLVHRDYEQAFVSQVGDTITIRKPAVFTADEYSRTSGINVQDATESGIPVQLNHFADVSFAVTAEQLTLDIQDFAEQLLDPAMEAIAQKIDRDVLTLHNDVTQETGDTDDSTNGEYLWSDPRSMIAAGELLDKKNVPPNERRMVVGPTTASRWIADPLFHEADTSGSTEGLREANLGRRTFGFTPYMTQNVGPPPSPPQTGDPTTEVNVAFHRTAFALAVRPLALPRGAQNAAIANYQGFGLRVIYDYDMDTKQDVVSIDCLYGTKTLDANRAVLVKGTDAAA